MQETKGANSHHRPIGRRAGTAIVLAAVLAVFVGVLVVGSSPTVCGWCHNAQADRMAAGDHATERCYDCHLANGMWSLAEQKGLEIGRMYPSALLGRGLTQPARPTGRSACLECHSGGLLKTTDVNGLRIRHATCATGPTCDTCHSAVAHGIAVRWRTGPVMDECISCHEARNASVECESCHSESPGEREKTTTAWATTHGPNWAETHGMGDQDSCGTCHQSGFCAKCHQVPVPHPLDFGATHGTFALEDEEACLTCHKSQDEFCDGCHRTEMPHPASFISDHRTIATSEQDPACIWCHVETDCDQCHTYHVHPGGADGVPVPWTLTPEALRP